MSALIFVPNQRVNTTFGTNYCVPPKSWLDEQLMFIKQGFGVGYLYNSGIKNFLNLGTISAIFMNSFARLVEVTTTYAADF